MVELKDFLAMTLPAAALVLTNFHYNWMSWNYTLIVAAAIGFTGFYSSQMGYLNQFLSSIPKNQKEHQGIVLKVEPEQAMEKLNEKIRDSPGYKTIDTDTTGESSRKTYTDTQIREWDGEKHFLYGIISMPQNPGIREYIAYIYDLTDDRIMKYSSDIWKGESRVQPFKGKGSWFRVEGLNVQDLQKNEGGGDTVIQLDRNQSKKNGGG